MRSSEIDALAALLRRHRELYYRGEPEISDAEFDALEDQLRALAPDHEVLGEVGAPVGGAERAAAPAEVPAWVPAVIDELTSSLGALYAGAAPAVERRYEELWHRLRAAIPGHPAFDDLVPPPGEDWPKARHELPMGSLNKVNSPEELREWAARCDELALADGRPPATREGLAITEKLDGLSVEVVYQGGALEVGITRGDGLVGERITPNVRRMKGVPGTIAERRRVSVRGEILLRRSDGEAFVELKRAIDKKFSGVISLRNTAAGLARAKELRMLPACRLLTVWFYDVEGLDELGTEAAKIAWLAAQGFGTPSFEVGDLERAIALYEGYGRGRRAELDHEIDGLVVRIDRLDAQQLLGELNHRPRAAIAFKFENEIKVTRLLEIRWETGDTGRITPVAIVEPVVLVGAKIERASLHNLARVRELDIGVGDLVLVSRRNDVIPYVEKVEVKGPAVEAAPRACARCGAEVVEDGEYLVCRSDDCPARRVGRLKIWIRQLGLLEWGERTLERFYELGLVREVADLYRLDVPRIAALEGFGTTSAEKLLAPLFAAKQIPAPVFIAGLGIEGVSLETAKILVKAGLDRPEAIAAATPEALAELPGLGAIKAARILEGMRARMIDVAHLAEVGVVPVRPADGGPLAGLSFCFSGTQSRPRKELVALVERGGGQVAASVTKGVTYLVLADKDSASSKAQKARKLGTEIIDEAGFFAILAARGAAG